MARLKCQGEEIARYVRVSPGDEDTEWGKTYYSVRKKDNGFVVLRKYQVRFKPTAYSGARNHDWGWQIEKKFKFQENLSNYIKLLEKIGYTKM